LQEQFLMDIDPDTDDEELGHFWHTVALLPPVTFEYVPAGHSTQAVELLAPATDEYAPAGHDTQVVELLAPAAAEYAPAEQFVHESTLLAPVTPEYFPGPQSVQTAAPATAYFPAVHATQTPLTLTYPAWHPHSDVSSSRSWPDGHGEYNHFMLGASSRRV
jgi:hypothetical protein